MFFFQVLNLVVGLFASFGGTGYVFQHHVHIFYWTQVVGFVGFFVSSILLSFYLFHVIEKLSNIPWNFFEMSFCIGWSFFYLTCAIDLIVKGKELDLFSNSMAKFYFFTYGTSILCFCGLLVYGIDAVLKFKKWKK